MDKQTPEFDLSGPTRLASGILDPVSRGEPCPRCGAGKLDYNGLLELECLACGYIQHEGAGCT